MDLSLLQPLIQDRICLALSTIASDTGQDMSLSLSTVASNTRQEMARFSQQPLAQHRK